jgi:MFS family permease
MKSESKALRSFRHHNYRLFWSANLLSNIGTWAQRIAQDWLVVNDLHKGGSELGIVTALQFLPAFLLSLHGGVLADKFQKRKMLVITNIGGGASSLIIGALVIAHKITLNEVFVLAFIAGIFSAIDTPVRQSFNSEIVPKEDVANAISLNSANFNTGRVIGPAISGLLIGAFHTGPSFIINGVSYFFVILALLLMKQDKLFLAPTKDKAPLREAFAYVKTRPDLMSMMSTVFFTATFGLNFQIFNTLIATKIFHKSPGAYGLLGTYLACGALLAAIISARTDKNRRPKRVVLFATYFGLVLAGLALTPNYGVYSLVIPFAGVLALSTMINANSYVQTTTPVHVRGRVMGIYIFIFLGTSPFGSLLIGYWSDSLGIRTTIFVCGLLTTIGSALGYLILRKKITVHPVV